MRGHRAEPRHPVPRPGLTRSGLPGLQGPSLSPNPKLNYNPNQISMSGIIPHALVPKTTDSHLSIPKGSLYHHYDC